jgi:hypothetical protein
MALLLSIHLRKWSLMKTKRFDAVELKRRGQEALLTRLEGMTPDEQREFWRQQNEELREWQRQLRAQRPEAVKQRARNEDQADHQVA